jgi:hypothetical protein
MVCLGESNHTMRRPTWQLRMIEGWISCSSPSLINRTSQFHSSRERRTVCAPSPIVMTPSLVITTSVQSRAKRAQAEFLRFHLLTVFLNSV